MRAYMIAISACISIAGCTDTSRAVREDSNVTSSLQYDSMPCAKLLAQRNALAAQNGVAPDAKPSFTASPTGLGPFLPDSRSAAQREKGAASGQIDAMNRSLVRRECVKAPKPS